MKTIKQILLICLFLVSGQTLFGQSSVGLRLGYTIAQDFEKERSQFFQADDKLSRISFSIVTYFDLNEHFQLSVEPGYLKRGASFPASPALAFENKYNYNFLEFPINISFKEPVYKDKIELYAKVGYSVSLLVSIVNEMMWMNGEIEVNKINLEEADWADRFDHGVNGSAGVRFKIGNYKLFVEGTYYRGFRNFATDPFSTIFTTINFRSVNFGLGCLREI